MKRLLAWLPLLVIGTLLAPAVAEDAEKTGTDPCPGLAIRAARILTMAGDPIDRGTILIRDGKIEAVGPSSEVAIPEGFTVHDAGDAWAAPGFVDIHSHIGGSDINDMVYPVNPDLRADDNVVPDNARLRRARAGGVTTILFTPGSGTNMGGFAVLMKTFGKTPEEAILRFPGALKVAQAGNPERRAGGLGTGRTGMSHLIKKTIEEGLAYGDAWAAHERGERPEPPPTDERYELFRGLAKREFPVMVHTQVTQVLQATIRILHDELNLPCVLSHASFDAYRNASLVAARDMAVNVGPRQIHYDGRTGRIRGLAHTWWEGGAHNLTLNTDAPVVPQEDLVVQACVAVRFGLSEDAALRGITIQCARQLMIDHRVGSLEPGKDADIVLHSRHPLDLRSRILGVYVNGRLVNGDGGAGLDDRPGLSFTPEHVHDDDEEDE